MLVNSLRQITVLLLLLTLLGAESDQPVQDMMKKPPPVLPLFRYPLSKLNIPSLEILSTALARGVRTRIYDYATEFSIILVKHLTSETEVQIDNGCITEDSQQILKQLETEKDKLQYSSHLRNILSAWMLTLVGQPVYPAVHNFLHECIQDIYKEFETFILKLQAHARKQMHTADMQLCIKACKSDSKILNLTGVPIPLELDSLFKDGSNFVPQDSLSFGDLKDHIEKDLIAAAINFFRDENKVYPLVNQTSGLKSVLEQLMSQAPSNSKQIEFFATLLENYQVQLAKFHNQLSASHFLDSTIVENKVPHGTILSTSDKGLGPVLLPVDWYVEQYKVQSLKGKHITTNMSADQCINFLKETIAQFRAGLDQEERSVLRIYFSNSSPNYKVGVMKLVPKIHKLSSFDSSSWKKLPSRPIRGAENCPVNPYSKALCKMLQEMHASLKVLLAANGTGFPLIYGCDEYSEKVHKVEFEPSKWSMNTLVSADFSDAYTKSSLLDLQGSLTKLGNVAGWPKSKISLAKKLAKLVFENCFFETPSGILRQSQGFPMGGHSSREGLDNILLSCELDLLSSPIREDLMFYYRLVDDISLALNGPFSKVRTLVESMALVYPHEMPLNIQISFGYSHFLDSHVYNFLQSTSVNSFTTSLAYKPLSKFDYVPFSSNIAPLYKGNFH
jgi:hypothetical protein